jgi:hypothetical protein
VAEWPSYTFPAGSWKYLGLATHRKSAAERAYLAPAYLTFARKLDDAELMLVAAYPPAEARHRSGVTDGHVPHAGRALPDLNPQNAEARAWFARRPGGPGVRTVG